MLEFLIFIGLIIIILGLSSHNQITTNSNANSNSNANELSSSTGSFNDPVGVPPDDLGTQFWGLFQNPNLWVNGYTIKEVPQNVYFKSTSKLNNRNHDTKF